MGKLYGSIEAGGTKFVCAVGDEEYTVVDKTQFPTTTPEETIAQTIAYFKAFEADLAGIAIGSFGPIDIDPSSETYGYITTTPKPGWANVDLLGRLSTAFEIPFDVTTDVNSSAYGEALARPGVESLVYYTIGTGIGAGAIQKGEFVGGLGHTEAGHTYVMAHPEDVEHGFLGVCPFHKGCLEGMASGPSLEARTGTRGELIEQDASVWDVQAFYIAQAALQATMLYRPQVIVFGGGVMAQDHMVMRVHEKFKTLLNDYLPVPDLPDYIVTPAVADNGSATLGNFALAKLAAEGK
ncbi:fructokinase ScrK [Streptococcus dysgalactiae]|uniref:fructokinase n=1 Tax=Streptococcus dysgalactiae TaxID=1334 RepID=A0ABU0A526_STRDY|nr:fructokinase ScrK [Streptococcus dysgalactiae]EGL49266.1 ROK family protein [Streptococcus dysgalactiae subsp. equisimilis SK1249]EGR89037.1 ROK family protein [Streptococcus dysgalactiae subsp. equisimilis SK1250]KKC23441.1 fructokinase [Streptococcus dysgalactiae subsp. equisimilis]MBM6513476.1 ROK family protein [Streptococcus dysgalactiae subsp. equisimilis]MBM6532845.1 ROK family protein [Streptococcus dysgalactiae subsp. equisimilis]